MVTSVEYHLPWEVRSWFLWPSFFFPFNGYVCNPGMGPPLFHGCGHLSVRASFSGERRASGSLMHLSVRLCVVLFPEEGCEYLNQNCVLPEG